MGNLHKTILLVEDDAIIAISECRQLEKEGYKVIHVLTGELAVDYVCVQKKPVDLVLMDIDLGAGMDGTECARIILDCFDIPILFLSMHTEKEIVVKTESITNYGYVVKNSSFTVLDASIKMAFRLFEASRLVNEQRMLNEAAYEEMQVANENLIKTQHELVESEETFRALFEKGPIGVAYHRMIYDDQGKPVDYYFLDANASYRELTGVNPTGKLVTEAFPGIEHDPADWIGTFGVVAREGTELRFQQHLQHNDRWYDCVAYQYKPHHFVAAFLDITEQKKTQAVLDEQNSILNALLDNLPIGVFMVEAPSGRPLVANEVAKQLLGRGILPDVKADNIGEVYQAFLRNTDTIYPLEQMPILKALKGEKSYVDNMDVIKSDGSRSMLEVYGSPVIDKNGAVKCGLVSFNDITERKYAEQKIMTLLSEKDLILREVNHRIKNNMNIIGSLLRLQSDSCNNQDARNILLDADGRIKSMMVLYEKLYQSDNQHELSIKKYFDTLIPEIVDVFPNRGVVRLNLKFADIYIAAEFLSPLGIIVNELITNSMKYAFPEAGGVISLEITTIDSRLMLDYHDNGIGLPESVQLENSSGFGMQLIKILVAQIRGSIRVESDQGTRFVIELSI